MDNISSAPKESRVIALSLLVLLIVVGGYLWLSSRSVPTTKSPIVTAVPAPAVVSHEPAKNVQVVQGDTTATSSNALPDGFPTDIPVDTTHLTESYKAFYSTHNVTQYTVSFISTKSQATLWKQYDTALPAAGYVIDKSMSNQATGQIVAAKGNDTLNVLIFSQDNSLIVQINLLDKTM
jgi:hypothetical protein